VWLWDIDPSENNIEDYIDTPIAFYRSYGRILLYDRR